jgi:putative membrane protein
MRGILVRWLVLTLAVLAASYLLDGIRVSGFASALGAAALLGILNALVRPILLIVTLPINILTLGLFTFVINALLLMMVSGVIGGFEVRGFWTAIGGSLVISLVSWLLNGFTGRRGTVERVDYVELRKRGSGRWE